MSEMTSTTPYILVADDDPLMLKSLQIILRKGGFRVLTVSDGVAALEQMRTERPALAILDVMMARLNGLDLCRTIKSDTALAAVKVFLLTARAMPSERQQGMEAGADDYITKPFGNAELVNRVRQAIGAPAPAAPAEPSA
jgi:DNA-binding response OmpR family regulator